MPDWQQANWGTNYPRLLELKRKYDPQNLFIVRQGVGSEFWDDEQDGEGEVDQLGEHEYEPIEDNDGSTSNDSSVTLSSKGSKRAYSEVGDEYEEEGDDMHPSIHSPGKLQPFLEKDASANLIG